MRGFFSRTELSVVKPVGLIPQCGKCGLYRDCRTPKMPVYGEGKKKILVVGEAPGETEDRMGVPFAGPAGAVLKKHLLRNGVDLRRDCWVTNALICHPRGNKIPTPKCVDHCRPNLVKTLRELRPTLVLLLGGMAMRSLLAHLWKDELGAVGRWVGWRIPCGKYGCWVCPTYHPASILHQKKDADRQLVEMFFAGHLRDALRDLPASPVSVPDYRERVEKVFDPREAARRLDAVTRKGGLAAFDYETDRLKPDCQDSRIVCCSICDGARTMAFPWLEPARTALGRLLREPRVRKVASNMKFEERWTRKEFGFGVAGWAWDTMLNAHVLDNRPRISSIKFQAFVRLGAPDYDRLIKPHLKGKGGNGRNRVREVDLGDLLLYCGLDSLLEYEVALLQMKEMNHADGERA